MWFVAVVGWLVAVGGRWPVVGGGCRLVVCDWRLVVGVWRRAAIGGWWRSVVAFVCNSWLLFAVVIRSTVEAGHAIRAIIYTVNKRGSCVRSTCTRRNIGNIGNIDVHGSSCVVA